LGILREIKKQAFLSSVLQRIERIQPLGLELSRSSSYGIFLLLYTSFSLFTTSNIASTNC